MFVLSVANVMASTGKIMNGDPRNENYNQDHVISESTTLGKALACSLCGESKRKTGLTTREPSEKRTGQPWPDSGASLRLSVWGRRTRVKRDFQRGNFTHSRKP